MKKTILFIFGAVFMAPCEVRALDGDCQGLAHVSLKVNGEVVFEGDTSSFMPLGSINFFSGGQYDWWTSWYLDDIKVIDVESNTQVLQEDFESGELDFSTWALIGKETGSVPQVLQDMPHGGSYSAFFWGSDLLTDEVRGLENQLTLNSGEGVSSAHVEFWVGDLHFEPGRNGWWGIRLLSPDGDFLGGIWCDQGTNGGKIFWRYRDPEEYTMIILPTDSSIMFKEGWQKIEISYGPCSLSLSPDLDGDGLPNEWEEKYGLDPEDSLGDNGPDGDPDQDGISNMDEYILGSDPKMINAFINVHSVNVTWNGISGVRYQIHSTSDLDNPVWEKVGAPIMGIDGLNQSPQYTIFPEKRFFKVEALQE